MATHNPLARHALALTLCAGGLSCVASAQWTVIVLHPSGATNSEARGIDGAQQVGVSNANLATSKAILWTGSGPSLVVLNPVVSGQSSAGITATGQCNAGNQQAGEISVTSPSQGVGFFSHASLWSGTAQSWVDLHPSDPLILHTNVFGMDAATQVGSFAVASGATFSAGLPCMWSGTAGSFVDLTPAGIFSGEVRGVSGNQQVGATFDTGLGLACMWSGSADTFVNLNPEEALFSAATCTDGAHQYGVIGILDPVPGLFPVRWSGTAASWVNLGVDDPNTRWGEVHATSGGVQVGYTTDNDGVSNERAAIWFNDPLTFADINQYLPPQYNGSNALGVWRHPASGTLYIVGYADNAATTQREAIMWVNGTGVNLITSPVAPNNCSVAVGGALTYTVRVLNAGPDASGAVTLTVDLPPAGIATFASAVPAPTTVTPTQLVFNLSPIAGSGALTDVSISLTAAGAGATATISAAATTAGEADPTNNTASASSRIQPAAPGAAPAKAIFSTNPAQPNSLVPGGGGARFTSLNRPFASPSGTWWVESGATDAATSQNLVLARAQTGAPPAVIARKGVTATSNGILGVFDVGAEVNDSGVVAIAGLDSGPSTSNRFIATTSGGPLADAARKGQPIPAIPGVIYNSNVGASANIFSNGQVGFSTDSSPTGSNSYISGSGSTVVARVNVTTPTGASFPIRAIVTNNTSGGYRGGINFDASGSHYAYQADLNTGSTTNDQVFVADGTVIMQEGVTVLPGFSAPIDGTGKDFTVGPAGDWLVHGKNADFHEAWVARGSGSAITAVYKAGDPIFAGATETWQPDLTMSLPLVFMAQLADAHGNFVIGGTTSADTFTNTVLVLNNQRVIARENDPVDLDGNGLFDDGVYIQSFPDANVAFVSGGVLAVVTLRDSAAALCHLEDVSQGQALIFIPVSTCGTADFNCDGDVGTDADIEAFFACLAGTCPNAPCTNSADFNGDGDVGTDADIEAFFRVLAGGSC